MVKAFADAWFFTVETSNTSSRNKNHATVDAHVSVLYPYLILLGKVHGNIYILGVGSSLLVSLRRVSSKTSTVERVTAWVPRFSCTYFIGVVQLFE